MELALNEMQSDGAMLQLDSNAQSNVIAELQLVLVSGGVGEVSPF